MFTIGLTEAIQSHFPDRLVVKEIGKYEGLLPHGQGQEHLTIRRIGAALHFS